MESVGQNKTFSEHGVGAYQIKENHKCSNMVANILPTDTPDPEVGVNRSKFNFFSEYGHVAYQIKENHKCSNIIANILPADKPTLGSVGQNSIFFEHGPVAYQIEENHEYSNIVANILHADSLDPGDGVNRSKFNFFRSWSCCILI